MKKKSISIALLLIISTIGTAVATSWYFSLYKPSSLTILPQTYGVELFSDPPYATVVVTSINFPTIMQGSITTSDTVSLYAETDKQDFALKWHMEGLPADASITAYYSWPYGTPSIEWPENTEIVAINLPMGGSLAGLTVFWTIDTDAADVGVYDSISIVIEAGNPSA